MKNILFLATLFGATLSWANAKVIGNGGQGIYCPKTKKIELFDFYEASVIRGLKVDLGNDDLHYEYKIEIALERWRKIDPYRYRAYRAKLDNFKNEARFVSSVELTPIADANSLIVPKDCQLVQMAIQKQPSFPDEAYYLIDKDKWDLMNSTQKAGLVLHEIIYREALKTGAVDSKAARYLNSSFAANIFTPEKFAAYNEVLKRAKFRRFVIYNDVISGRAFFASHVVGPDKKDQMDQGCNSFENVNGRTATEDEVNKAYPDLGHALVNFLGSTVLKAPSKRVMVIDSQGRTKKIELKEKDYSISTDNVGVGALCVMNTNENLEAL